MKLRNLLSAPKFIASLVAVVGMGITSTSPAHADTTLPPVEIVGPDCGLRGVPVFAGDEFVGCFSGDLGGGGRSYFPPGSPIGGGGGTATDSSAGSVTVAQNKSCASDSIGSYAAQAIAGAYPDAHFGQTYSVEYQFDSGNGQIQISHRSWTVSSPSSAGGGPIKVVAAGSKCGP